MKIIILGAGAIGSYYGARLSKHNDVTLIGRKKHVKEINKNGLKIKGLEHETYFLKAGTGINNIEDNTLIVLATKVQDSAGAISKIKNLVKKDAIIICLQNGLDSEGIVRKILGNKCLVLRAVTNFGVIFLKPGIIDLESYSFTSIENSRKSPEIADNFTKCGLNANVSKNIRQDVWKKLILNCALNPITAVLGIKNGDFADETLNPLKKLICDECAKVAEKEGAKFEINFIKAINEAIKNSGNLSSMQQDLIKGKKTEIDYLNGAVVGLGKKYGIDCPVNEALISIIKSLEKKALSEKSPSARFLPSLSLFFLT